MFRAPREVLLPLVEEVLGRGEEVWVRVASPSMAPLIRPGEELRLAPLGTRPLVGGALIAYREGERLVIHRVLALQAGGVTAKGDALASPDPPVSRDRIVARVVAFRRPGGRVVELGRFPWPLVERLLGRLAALACRLPPGGTPGSRLGWKTLRAPFHLARLLLG